MNPCMNACRQSWATTDGERTKDARRDDEHLDGVDDVDRLASVWTSTTVDDEGIIIIIIIIGIIDRLASVWTSTTVDDEGIIMVIVVVDRRGGGWMWTRGTIGRRTVVARRRRGRPRVAAR